MIDAKANFSGGLDLDTSDYKLPKNSYRDAFCISRNSIEGGDQDITNLVGNIKIDFTYPEGSGKYIGLKENQLRNTVIGFRWNENNLHGIYEYNHTTRAITKIFENLTDSAGVDVLGFSATNKITSIDILNRDEGDLVFFLDSLGRPSYLNIAFYKTGFYAPVTRAIIDLGKQPPLYAPSSVYGNDTTKRTNSLKNKFFRFKYRYILFDNFKTTFSPISAMAMPDSILDDTFTNVITNNNLISISYYTGSKEVKAVELAVSFCDKSEIWSDFLSVEVVNKSDNSIGNDTYASYSFYGGSFPGIDVNESDQLFDFVPDFAGSQSLVNGDVLAYADITEGYPRTLTPDVDITIDTIAAGNGSSIGSLSVVGVFTGNSGGYHRSYFTFSGIPATGTVITFTARRRSDGVQFTAMTYTTQSGDSTSDVTTGLDASLIVGDITANAVANVLDTTISTSVYMPIPTSPDNSYWIVEITPPATPADKNSIATWAFSTGRTLALAYFNKKGKTNGVLYSTGINFPAYAENGSQQVLLPFINAKIYHQAPIWADSYQWLISKEPTRPLFWQTSNVNTSETSYLYFEVTNFKINTQKLPTTSNVLEYTFQDGDRMRLIRRVSDNTVFADTYDVPIEGLLIDPKISSSAQVGYFIKTKKIAPLAAVDYSSKNFVIQIYRPGQQLPNKNNEVFYEFGAGYPIINPGEDDRVHGGMVTDQSIDFVTPAEFNFYNGDVYFRSRSIYITENAVSTFYVQDRNVVDTYISAVSSIDGRSNGIDINAKTTKLPATIRHGQAYQKNTNINGLNRFYENNFLDCDDTFGAIQRMTVRDRFMRILQMYKIGQVPLYSQIVKEPNGNNVSVVTDKLLNPVQYYLGDVGIGEHKESLASHDYADFFSTNVKGYIGRVSQNGVDVISVLGKVDSWATSTLPLRVGTYKAYGAFDQRLGKYILAQEAVGDLYPAATIVFDEPNKSFECFHPFHPEMMCSLGVLLVSAKDGEFYTHDSTVYNNFFGVQYTSYITPVFNDNVIEGKSFKSVDVRASSIWECPDIKTQVNTYGSTPQSSRIPGAAFEELEGKYCAAFLCDTNSSGGLINGNDLKGNFIKIRFQATVNTTLTRLSAAMVHYINSPLVNK